MGFHISKTAEYITHFPYYLKHYKWTRYIKELWKRKSPYGIVTGGYGEAYCFQINDYTIPHEMYVTGKTWSESEMRLFFEMTENYYSYKAQPGDIFIDIGANIGTTSIWAAKNIGKNIRIYAFEANPDTYRVLQANVVLNRCDNICAINMAVGNKEEFREMYTFTKNTGRNQIVTNCNKNMYEMDDVEKIKVYTTTIEKWINKNSIDASKIKYIWIDAEGFEPFILDGMKKLLKKQRIPIFTEFSADVMSEDMLRLLCDAMSGYKRFISIDTLCGEKKQHDIGYLKGFYDEARKNKNQYNLFFF